MARHLGLSEPKCLIVAFALARDTKWRLQFPVRPTCIPGRKRGTLEAIQSFNCLTNCIRVVQHFGVAQPSRECDCRQVVAQKEHRDGEDVVPPLRRAQKRLARPARPCLNRTDQVCDLGAKRRRKRDGRWTTQAASRRSRAFQLSAFTLRRADPCERSRPNGLMTNCDEF